MNKARYFLLSTLICSALFSRVCLADADVCQQIAEDPKYSQIFATMKGGDVDAVLAQDPCYQAANIADQCCGNPASCLFATPNGDDTDSASLAAQVIQLFSGVALAIPGDMSAMCNRMNGVADLTLAMNVYMSASCNKKQLTCSNECKPKLKNVQNDLNNAAANGDKSSLCKSVVYRLNQLAEGYRAKVTLCNQASTAHFAMLQQNVATGLAKKFSNMCKDQAVAANSFNTPNCLDPAMAATPFCQYACGQPGAAANPTCAALIASSQQRNSAMAFGLNSSGIPGAAGGRSLFDGVPTPPENQQSANYGAGAKPDTGLAQTPGGPAGSGGLGGGGAQPSGLGTVPTGGKGGGYDIGILRGVASGNGYSQGARTGNNGGFSGYGGGSAQPDNLLGRKFSLKDFLPGGKEGSKQAPFRGLASIASDISPAHDDIFQKVTNRFYQVCLRNGLYDCASLQKVKAGN